ncbi:MAG: SAM-dependent methyltransferase, partial [Nitrospirae bacterium]|nr:SAM-dependent methyltransferase [Nitrospirota bacterium]
EHNPIIKVYRKIAKEVRTEDEHPITMADLSIFGKYFSNVRIETTWFFTLWIFIRYYFFDRVNPNKVRFWKKILVDHRELERTYIRLEAIDRIFLKIFPFMKRYCWNIVILSRK